MKQRTKEQILEKLTQMFKDGDYWDEARTVPRLHPTEFKVVIEKDRVRLQISRMYDSPSIDLKKLMALAEFFGTTNINDDRFEHGGCETCDYGSNYGAELTIRPEK